MPARVTVIVGTRKGCFLLESDSDRRDWSMRGPYCDGWPVYHAIHDPATGTIYAAAASSWHGVAHGRGAGRSGMRMGSVPDRGRTPARAPMISGGRRRRTTVTGL